MTHRRRRFALRLALAFAALLTAALATVFTCL